MSELVIDYGESLLATPTHSAFIGAASSGQSLLFLINSDATNVPSIGTLLLGVKCDDSFDEKASDKSSDSETYASCDSSLKTKTKDFPPAVDIKTLPESDVEDLNSTAGSPSFSCSENWLLKKYTGNKEKPDDLCRSREALTNWRTKVLFTDTAFGLTEESNYLMKVSGKKHPHLKALKSFLPKACGTEWFKCFYYDFIKHTRAWYASCPSSSNGPSIMERNKAWCDAFEELMKGEFEMSAMGEMTFFLGLQVKQLPDGLFISQDKYVQDMLTKFDMESVRTATTPYEAAKTKLKDETDPPVNVHLYRSMIGSLMYLTASRPDIMFAVSACSRHQVTPLTSHLNAVKKIFKYLKGQPKLGLWYPKDSPFQLEAYSDSDYAGSHGDRKSTTGGCQFLGRRLISWQCKKQTIVATSSTEAEYVAAASCCAQVLWIQNQLLDYGFNFMNTKIFIDNQSTICIVKNPVFHQRTKHIEIRHHFIRDANEKNLIQVLKIHTDDNVADLLTKAFDGPRFAYLVVHIGMVDMVLVSAGCTMVLLVVILPAGRMVSAGWSMVLLVVIFPAARLVSAGCTMVLLEVIVPAGFFVPAGSYGLCCW
ncbi:putative ribonuclease H-like domain-containing protein [Tanacetum coccineum]|uniref:Ribonuclease H-like domain-containing protein n=1 Tax=Tanacetum coccineum TaxID=301880 RepID=A0ABQ5I828_9ASTR